MRRRLLVLLISLPACTDSEAPDVSEPQSTSIAVVVSGELHGPDGTSICNSMESMSPWGVRVIDPATEPDAVVASDFGTCPANAYSLEVPQSSGAGYLLRVSVASNTGTLPSVYYDARSLVVNGPVARNVRVRGRELRGRAVLDGVTTSEGSLTAVTSVSSYAGGVVGFASSGDDGNWEDFFLQPGRSYTLSCNEALGMRSVTDAAIFLFPNDRVRFDCRYRTSGADRWTHRATQLLLTAWPGTLKYDYDHNEGYGWGVQYPVSDVSPPSRHQSAMFDAGFFISSGPDVVSTFDSDWLCGTCGQIAPTTVRPRIAVDGDSKRVAWTLAGDPVSSAGLSLRQTSEDGAGGDYILYQLRITNGSASTVETYVGGFFDWDVGQFFADNSGATSLDGRLAYITAPGEGFFGSIFLGRFASRGTWFDPDISTFSEAELLDILEGDTQVPSAPGPRDVRFIQSAGKLTLTPGQSKVVYLAIVAGGTLAELEANANAAASDYTARTGRASE